MSLKIYTDVIQGSDEWHDLRLGKITASTLGKFITPTGKVANNQTSRSAVAQLAAERLSGRGEDPLLSRDVQRGHLDEPLAAEAYEDHTGLGVYEVGFMVRDFTTFEIGFSPDRLTADPDGFIEIKSRKPRLQIEYVLSNEVPHDHYVQVQTGLLVSEMKWCDYVSYSGGLPLSIKRIFPDPEFQRLLVETANTIEGKIQDMMVLYQTLTHDMPMTEYVDHWGDDLDITF